LLFFFPLFFQLLLFPLASQQRSLPACLALGDRSGLDLSLDCVSASDRLPSEL